MAAELEPATLAPAPVRQSGWRAGLPRISLLLMAVVVVAGLGGAVLTPHDPQALDLSISLKPPAWLAGGSLAYPLGTDNLGRDVLSRIIAGAKVSLIVAFYGILLSGALGSVIGMVSGYFGGVVDSILMRIVDIKMSIPSLALALMMTAMLDPGLNSVIIVIVVSYWAWYARIVRGEILSLRERDYIALARVAGVSTPMIFVRHLLPNILNLLLVLATLQIGQVIIFEAGLSFLGLGIQTPDVSWGLMLADGRNNISAGWWLTAFPGMAIMITCLSSNLIGDWLRDTFDPRRRQM